MKHVLLAFHQLASVVRLFVKKKKKAQQLTHLFFFPFCSTTITCAEKRFVHFQKVYINFGIFNPYSCTLEGWMHQVFSILPHCSAFKSCCLLQWDTGKALLLNFYSFFFLGFNFLFKSTNTSIYFLTPVQYFPTGIFDFLPVKWDSSVHISYTQCFCFRTLFMSQVHGQMFTLFGEKSTDPFFVWCVLVCWSSTTVGYILLLSDCERISPSKSWIWK